MSACAQAAHEAGECLQRLVCRERGEEVRTELVVLPSRRAHLEDMVVEEARGDVQATRECRDLHAAAGAGELLEFEALVAAAGQLRGDSGIELAAFASEVD